MSDTTVKAAAVLVTNNWREVQEIKGVKERGFSAKLDADDANGYHVATVNNKPRIGVQ